MSTAACGDGAAFAPLVAANLAVYLRALHDGLPLLFASLAPVPGLDRFLAFDASDTSTLEALPRLDAAWQSGGLNRSLALGRFGIYYVRAASTREALARCSGGFRDLLERARWGGLHVIESREAEPAVARRVEAACDRLLLPVHDLASLARAGQRLEDDARAAQTGRILVCGVDRSLRVSADGRDALAVLRDEIARRRWPAYESFLSRSPDVEARLVDGAVPQSVLHAASDSSLHRQFRALAEEVARDLELARFDRSARGDEDRAGEPEVSPADAWRRLVLARRPRALPATGAATRTVSRAAQPVRAAAEPVLRKGAS